MRNVPTGCSSTPTARRTLNGGSQQQTGKKEIEMNNGTNNNQTRPSSIHTRGTRAKAHHRAIALGEASRSLYILQHQEPP